MDYEIEIKDIEPIRVAAMYYKGIVTEAAKVFPLKEGEKNAGN